MISSFSMRPAVAARVPGVTLKAMSSKPGSDADFAEFLVAGEARVDRQIEDFSVAIHGEHGARLTVGGCGRWS